MKLTNKKMDEYFMVLSNMSEKATGRLGYAIARNLRKLSEELVEYQTLKDKTINKYGEVGDDGVARIRIDSDSEAFKSFAEDMKEYMDIEHDVQIFTVSEDEVINSPLNAKEMLSIDFMIIKEVQNE